MHHLHFKKHKKTNVHTSCIILSIAYVMHFIVIYCICHAFDCEYFHFIAYCRCCIVACMHSLHHFHLGFAPFLVELGLVCAHTFHVYTLIVLYDRSMLDVVCLCPSLSQARFGLARAPYPLYILHCSVIFASCIRIMFFRQRIIPHLCHFTQLLVLASVYITHSSACVRALSVAAPFLWQTDLLPPSIYLTFVWF